MTGKSIVETLMDAMRAYGNTVEAARESMQTYHNPSWLDTLDEWASHMVGVLFIWARLMTAIAVLMWSFFLVVLPLILASWLIVALVATAMPHGLAVPASR